MKTTSCDVLILGGGSAGLWAAYSCAQKNPEAKIVIVDKGPRDWGGLMTMAGGDFEAVLAPDTVDEWIQDFVYYFDGLCDQKLMEEILTRSRDRLEDYERFGCEFFKTEDGSRKFVRQRGLDHVKLYPAQLKGRGGELMVKNLVKQLEKMKVQRMGRILLGSFLRQGDRVCGALGFDCITGERHRFDAKVVIAATGMGGWKTSYGKNTPTGETMMMAYEAGAHLQNMEFARVWNMPRLFGWEGQTVLMPLGARFVNGRGEPIMDRYSPVLGANTDPHYTTIAMAMEVREGRGPITFDLSNIKDENLILLRPQNGWQKLNYDKLSALGLDLFHDSTEWVPQMTVAYGGIRADARGTPAPTPDTDVEAEFERMFAPLGKSGLHFKEVLRHIQSVVFPYDVSIIKTEESLERARRELVSIIENEVPAMAAEDPHYLLKVLETRAIAFVSLMYVKASLERRETRAGHFREDYPTRNENELAWLCLKKGESTEPDFYRVRVPLEEYRFPVTRYYQDNFTFGKQ